MNHHFPACSYRPGKLFAALTYMSENCRQKGQRRQFFFALLKNYLKFSRKVIVCNELLRRPFPCQQFSIRKSFNLQTIERSHMFVQGFHGVKNENIEEIAQRRPEFGFGT